MKKLVSILIAIILMAAMTSDMFAGYFSNDIYDPQYFEHIDNNMEISGTNSFGNMLSAVIDDELAEQQENAGYNVISVDIVGQTATVELSTLCDSTVVVGIYDEAGEQLLMTASAPVTQEDEYVTVSFERSLPQYFFIKAYLIDSTTLRPLCTVYDCPNYTQEMQEFFAKTVYDFNPEKVLNLDSDVTNNFAVYSDNVTVIPQVEGVNTLLSQGGGVYIFANADENVLALQPGQIFSYEYAPGEVIIAKVAAVTENPDGTVTVSEQDAELEDAFEYIKIDTEAGMEKAEVDNSNLEEGIEFVGMTHDSQPINADAYGIMPMAIKDEGETGGKLTYNFKKEKKGDENLNVTFQGAIDFGIKAKMKYYISHKLKYIEVSLEYSVKLKVKISGKGELKFPIGFIGISPLPGVYIELTPSFLVEASAEIEWNVELSGSVGTRLSTDGNRDISKSPKFDSELKLEGKFALGIIIEPKITVVHEKIADVKLKAESKIEASGKLVGYDTSEEVDENKQHLCKLCIEGEVNAIINAEFKAKLLDNKKWEFKFTLLELKYKIKDFYFSVDNLEFGFGTCPYCEYLYTVHVIGNWLAPLEGAKVELDGVSYTTDSAGDAKFYILKDKEYTATVFADGYKPKTVDIHLSNILDLLLGSYNKKTVCLIDWDSVIDYVGDIGSGGGGDVLLPDGSKRVKQVSHGYDDYSAAITVDGCLYMWGDNYYGELGNGTNKNHIKLPIKIMDNVASVSLGYHHSAAITTDGSLYMWGYNGQGQLGNGTYNDSNVPIKIMDNVVSVSLGYYHSAAITTDGNLYMWGHNGFSQLGNGKSGYGVYETRPVKIMGDVVSVSLGYFHSSAITTDGSLYIWGDNTYGQLGNGKGGGDHWKYEEGIDSNVPIKIMDNVASVNLGEVHSAAITTDGSLYMWGENYSGQLGNGKEGGDYSTYDGEIDSNVPIKIIDNIATVSLGHWYSAAITTDGSLYMWGLNEQGQLGNGTTENSNIPIKIMDNIASVSLEYNRSAAISTDGILYMWGANGGDFGNGTSKDSNVPIQISIPADEPAPTSISTLSYMPMAAAETSPTSGTFTGLIPNEIYNIYALRSRTAAEPLAPSNLLYITQATSDAAGNLPYNCTLLGDCPNPVIFCKAMHEFEVGNAQITAADITENSITVKWDAYPGADMYRVYRVVNGIYILEGEMDMTEYTVSGLVAGREYGFVVECRVNGEWSYRAADDVVYIQTEAEPEYTPGDVNADGNVTLDDAILTLKKAMNVSLGDETFNEAAADVTDDGEVTLDDAIAILKIAMNMTTP